MSTYEPSSADVLLIRLLANTILRPYYARYVRSLGLSGHEWVLDFGSGPGIAAGYIAASLAESGGRVMCVDVSRTWMQVARKATRRYPNVEYRLGRIGAVDIENAAFDIVLVHFCLHDIPARERAVTVHHLAGKLRPGGQLVVREPTTAGHGMSPRELGLLLASTGLQQVSVKTGRAALIQGVCDAVFQAQGGNGPLRSANGIMGKPA